MRHLLIGSILVLAACNANSADTRIQMDTCGNATDPDVAIAACNRLLDHAGLPDTARMYVYYSRGRAAMEKQDLAAALSDLNESIRLDGSQAVSFATRGIVHGTMGNMEAAIPDFTRAIELNPQDAVSFQNRGKAYSDTGKQPRAIQDFTRAIELGNDEAATRNGRCWARAILGQELDLAREDCEAAVRMEPEDGNNHNSLAFVRFRSGDYAGAIADYTTSLSLNPDGASSYYMRGRAKALTGDANAQADIDKGLGLEPGVAERYAGYGIAP
jgi:tetratricopeptide (TPR) repeat protein